MEPDDVLEELEELFDLIEKAQDSNPSSYDYCEGVAESARNMEDWISKNDRATEKQYTAVLAWKGGVEKWIR